MREPGITDLAQELSFGTIVLIEINGWSLTSWTGTGFGDIAVGTTTDWLDQLPVAFIPVWNQFLVCPILLVRLDLGKFIDLELLILGRMGIVKSPLLKWDISTDKIKKLADNTLLVLNDLK